MPGEIEYGAAACPVCSCNANVSKVAEMIDGHSVECPRCSRFLVPGLLLRTVLRGAQSDRDTKQLLPYLSAYIRQANERGEKVTLDRDHWKEWALAHANTSVPTKLTRFLEIIAARSKPGESVDLDRVKDAPLLDAFNSDEVIFYANTLYKRELIEFAGGDSYGLTAKGWEIIQSASVSGVPGRCFVAMSFDHSLDDAFTKGIESAVKIDCKMDPVRIDRVHHNEKICDKIVAEIRTCQFLVADVTLQRAGVYFEAGFAMG